MSIKHILEYSDSLDNSSTINIFINIVLLYVFYITALDVLATEKLVPYKNIELANNSTTEKKEVSNKAEIFINNDKTSLIEIFFLIYS